MLSRLVPMAAATLALAMVVPFPDTTETAFPSGSAATSENWLPRHAGIYVSPNGSLSGKGFPLGGGPCALLPDLLRFCGHMGFRPALLLASGHAPAPPSPFAPAALPELAEAGLSTARCRAISRSSDTTFVVSCRTRHRARVRQPDPDQTVIHSGLLPEPGLQAFPERGWQAPREPGKYPSQAPGCQLPDTHEVPVPATPEPPEGPTGESFAPVPRPGQGCHTQP
ncbi:hypothetical protein JW921_11520 [Candidatus Fermentibacterales bacterium]|nr:hypothetical protein [Candidatus Fermentibacterales bacterium]